VLDGDDRAFMGVDDTTNSTNIKVGAVMVINAMDIKSLSSFIDQSDINANYATKSTSINEGD
jgi:hypothetical protein